jgi:RNA polymerase subunit RPABC4/transcription elongation factor Spt4
MEEKKSSCPLCGSDMEDDYDGRVLVCSNRTCRYRIVKPLRR